MSLVVIKPSPRNAEAPLEALRTETTPNESFFVRTNFGTPELDPLAHRIVVDGLVTEPGEWSNERLRALGTVGVRATMECAGNGRLAMAPLPIGEQWAGGAVSTADWGGIPLSALLDAVRPSATARWLHIEGADRGVVRDRGGAPIPFARGMALTDARRAEVLLAMEMNGAPLPAEHGGPVRLVVPGWYGMASVKWISRITLSDRPFEGWFQQDRYIYRAAVDGDSTPVTRMRVRSRIIDPAPGAEVPRGMVTVRGFAWSGEGRITRVEIAVGGGEGWQPAQLGPETSDFAWRSFELTFEAKDGGRQTLRARATDGAGTTQPAAAEWNLLGYGNNGIDAVVVTIV